MWPPCPLRTQTFIVYYWNFEADKKAIETNFGHSCQTLGKMHHRLDSAFSQQGSCFLVLPRRQILLTSTDSDE